MSSQVRSREISYADVTARPGRAERVQVRLYVLVAADVEGAAYAPAGTHAAEACFGDEYNSPFRARGVECLVETMIREL